ncbi:hypothetical protein AMJ57_01695 [Parcubacteria bacterium SG8_24]|nr:MAG: hypothetical protein AMJ57_01695 [Parcubacteria bacterium SG8_24]
MGQLVPFPYHAVRRSGSRRSAPGRLILFIPPSRLFIAGMVAHCPALRTVVSRVGTANTPEQVARERILELLIRKMPVLPKTAAADEVESMHELPFDEICLLARRQLARSRRDRQLHAGWYQVWRYVRDLKLREFAQRSSTLLTEMIHISREATRRDAACC